MEFNEEERKKVREYMENKDNEAIYDFFISKGMIKLFINGEFPERLWAEKVVDGIAILDNDPVNSEYSYGDTVYYDEEFNVTGKKEE